MDRDRGGETEQGRTVRREREAQRDGRGGTETRGDVGHRNTDSSKLSGRENKTQAETFQRELRVETGKGRGEPRNQSTADKVSASKREALGVRLATGG